MISDRYLVRSHDLVNHEWSITELVAVPPQRIVGEELAEYLGPRNVASYGYTRVGCDMVNFSSEYVNGIITKL